MIGTDDALRASLFHIKQYFLFFLFDVLCVHVWLLYVSVAITRDKSCLDDQLGNNAI